MTDLLNYFMSYFSFQSDTLWVNIAYCILGLGMIAILILILSVIIYLIIDSIGFSIAACEYEIGIVNAKYYTPDQSHSRVGTGAAPDGSVVSVVTINHDDEKFFIEYKSDKDMKKYRIRTGKKYFDSLEIGDRVKAFYKISKTTGSINWTGDFEKYRN